MGDFFERVLDKKFLKTVDLIWDNPPYTSAETKEKVLRALAASGLPFAMLLPISVLHVAFVRDILNMAQVQVVIPRRVHVCKTGREEVPFSTSAGSATERSCRATSSSSMTTRGRLPSTTPTKG